MNLNCTTSRLLALCLSLAFLSTTARAGPPAKVDGANLWQSVTQTAAGTATGLDKGTASAKAPADLARDALADYKELSEGDKQYSPNYTPPGAPSVPSKCVENADCVPCYEKAYAGLNKSRINLEKVRARYNFTHRFTKLGQTVLTNAGAAGGGIAALGASAENIKIDRALADFDQVVKNKNQELLAKLQTDLQAISVCENKYYKNDDWYNRYGFIYYQFMLSSYSY